MYNIELRKIIITINNCYALQNTTRRIKMNVSPYMMYDMNLLKKSLDGIKKAVQGEKRMSYFMIT